MGWELPGALEEEEPSPGPVLARGTLSTDGRMDAGVWQYRHTQAPSAESAEAWAGAEGGLSPFCPAHPLGSLPGAGWPQVLGASRSCWGKLS